MPVAECFFVDDDGRAINNWLPYTRQGVEVEGLVDGRVHDRSKE